MRKLSRIILGIGMYTIAAEIANQYTTLLGYINGFYENDATARYLLSISPALETVIVLSIPFALISVAYITGVKWTPSTRNRKRIQTIITTMALLILVLLGVTTTTATISDLNTLHLYHIL